jgi:hypothetical protein
MSEFNENGVVGDAEKFLKPSFNTSLKAETVDFFLKAMDDRRTIDALRGSHAEYKIEEIERSAEHELFLRILSIRRLVDTNSDQVKLQIPLKEFEYEIMKNMGAVGHGYSENMPEESKINSKALDESFRKAKKEAGYPGPLKRFVDRMRGI